MNWSSQSSPTLKWLVMWPVSKIQFTGMSILSYRKFSSIKRLEFHEQTSFRHWNVCMMPGSVRVQCTQHVTSCHHFLLILSGSLWKGKYAFLCNLIFQWLEVSGLQNGAKQTKCYSQQVVLNRMHTRQLTLDLQKRVEHYTGSGPRRGITCHDINIKTWLNWQESQRCKINYF